MKMKGALALMIIGFVAVMATANEDKKKDEIGTVIGIDLGTTYSW